MLSSRKKNSPTLAELHKIFPPHESVKKYSYSELLKLYNESQARELVVPDSSELIDDYKNYLEKETTIGGSHPDKVNTEDFVVGKSYKYDTEEGTMFLVNFKKQNRLTNGIKATFCTFEYTYVYDRYIKDFFDQAETTVLLYDDVSGTDYYEVNSKDPTFKELKNMINRKNGIEDTESLKSHNSSKNKASFQSMGTTDSLIKRAPTFIQQCRPYLDNTVKSAEIYKNSKFQQLKALKNHQYIFGMQNVPNDCKELYQFMRFLREDNKIKRYACLQCGSNEEDMWKYVGLRVEGHEESFFYNRQIQDYTSYTFENAMAILKLMHDGKDTIVFHCTAGWGRTGSVMFLILLYFSAKHNKNVLRKPLTTKTHFTHFELEATLLAKEYSLEAAEEFYELNGPSCQLRCDRMNTAYQAVAHTLSLYDDGNPEIAYVQYNDYDNLKDQSTIFTEFVLQDKKDIIILADEDAKSPRSSSRSNKTIRSNRSLNKSIKSNKSSRKSSRSSSRKSSKTTKKSTGWLSNLMGE
jgi:protein-tyrosine phosphatase